MFDGDCSEDGMKIIKTQDGVTKQNNSSSSVAEEAVDQLQASEKLIAGKFDCFILIKVMYTPC